MKRFGLEIWLALSLLWPMPALAQLNGENLLGDSGVKSGSQPAPGTYVGFLYYRYATDTIKTKDGNTLTFDPSQRGSETLHASMPLVIHVTDSKLLGGNSRDDGGGAGGQCGARSASPRLAVEHRHRTG